jgi:acetyl-CoA synthetase
VQTPPTSPDALERWRRLSTQVLSPSDPFERHQQAFAETFKDWPPENGPAPAVLPSAAVLSGSNVGRWISELGFTTYDELHAFSVSNPEAFYRSAVHKLGIRFRAPFQRVLDVSQGVQRAKWFPGSRLNIVDTLLHGDAERVAMISRKEGESGLRRLSIGELDVLSARVANGLAALGFRPGDAIAIDMPMTPECVAVYLGIVRAGMVVVSIADSFAPPEIASRLRIAGAAAVFTQDVLRRDGRTLPLYDKIKSADAPRAIVIPDGDTLDAALRPGDLSFETFLSGNAAFDNVDADPSGPINVLFSSGTTGTPKAIPWTAVTPLRCALDGFVHQDIQPGDIAAWPTNVGWMMGPWLIFAALTGKAAIALYDGAPQTRGFCEFVQDAGVTMLGVVPSLVRTWRARSCVDKLDWHHIKAFSSTGEASNADDMLWLMSRAGYKPVIEYCGGTEIGGSYITSTVVQPNSPACFSAKIIGTEFVILDEAGMPSDEGELYLVPPSLGLSERLINANHDEVYFEGCPKGPHGETLRRHGDRMQALPGGFYRAMGRADDTMNLGGIKVSAVELERVMNAVEGVIETAAVAVPPEGGGPSRLVVYAVVDAATWEDAPTLQKELQRRLRTALNPLFRIDAVQIIDALPRTASNKVMRRMLRQKS